MELGSLLSEEQREALQRLAQVSHRAAKAAYKEEAEAAERERRARLAVVEATVIQARPAPVSQQYRGRGWRRERSQMSVEEDL